MYQATYVFGLLYLLIPSHPRFIPLRHIFSIAASCIIYFSFFDLAGFIELIGMAMLVYFAVYVGRSDKRVAGFVMIYALGHLAYRHVESMINDPSD
jgi:hypothetical protein